MFMNLNRQLLHENSSAQSQFDQIWNIWNHWVDSAWTGTTTGTVTFHFTGLDRHTFSAMCRRPLSMFCLRR